MNDFLSFFQKNIHPKEEAPYKGELSIQLYFEEGDACIASVDKQMTPVEANYRYYSGPLSLLLRSMEAIRKKQQEQIVWEGIDNHIKLKDFPYLLPLLAGCKNLIDEKGDSIGFVSGTASLQLALRTEELLVKPVLQVCSDEYMGSDFRFLTDSFVLAGNHIFPIPPAGEYFEQLSLFLSPFPKDKLEVYLSVFFSYISNVSLLMEGYTVRSAKEKVTPKPAILFEKVDSDLSLHLRVTQVIPGYPPELFSQFAPSQVAFISDNEIVLRPVEFRPQEADSQILHKQILQYAPNRQAQKEIYEEEDEFILPTETAGPFLLQGLPSLLGHFQLLGTEKLHKYKVKAVQPKLNLSISSGIDFLEGDAALAVDEEQIPLASFLAQYRKQKFIQLSDGNRAIIEESYIHRLERLFKADKKKVKVSFFDLPEIEDLLNEQLEGEVFHHYREVYEGFNRLGGQKLSLPRVNAELRPYQKEGVKWMKYLHDQNLGGCLADDMGLGKTLQTLSVLASLYPKTKRPTLIVMPRSLLFNWQNELEKFTPQLSACTYYGNQRDLTEAMKHSVILTTYAMVRNDVERFRKEKFHYVILDESQNIKNLSAQTTQAVLLLQAEHRLALSGTPVENGLTELYSLFRFLNPAMFGSAEEFNSRYTYPIQKNNDKEALESLRRKLFPFILRRLKKDVLSDLPDRIEQTLYVEMGKAQAELYEQRRKYYQNQVNTVIATEGIQKSQFVMFQALNELRRIASVPESLSDGVIPSPKLDTLIEMVTEAVANRHKVVIFYNFIAGIELTGEKLEAEGIDYTCMTGSTHDRRSVIERFQKDPNCMVLLMTLKTGGVGLNLTVADMVFIVEPWWNKAAEEQAINRLHRIGQTAKVTSYSLITRGSIEEKIRLLQQQKAELFEGLISNDSGISKQLSEEDIHYILS